MIPNLRQLVLWKFCESEKEGCHTVTPQVTTCVTWLIRNSTFQREFMLWCSCESDSRVVTELWRTMTGSSGPTYPGIIPYHTDPPSPSCPPRLIGAQHSSIDHHHHNHHIIIALSSQSPQSSPHAGVEHRPESATGSYGPPSAQVVARHLMLPALDEQRTDNIKHSN